MVAYLLIREQFKMTFFSHCFLWLQAACRGVVVINVKGNICVLNTGTQNVLITENRAGAHLGIKRGKNVECNSYLNNF